MSRRHWVWQQDNAPVHTAKIVRDLFKAERVKTIEWPARSPDLSPIENVWKVLQDKVYESGQFHDKQSLQTRV